jgi:hypothetical protein
MLRLARVAVTWGPLRNLQMQMRALGTALGALGLSQQDRQALMMRSVASRAGPAAERWARYKKTYLAHSHQVHSLCMQSLRTCPGLQPRTINGH